MPHVIKIPKRSDFCGCPPCGLCFDWVDDEPRAPIVDGLVKMAEDVTGKPIAKVTEPELKVVKAAAQEIHERNLAGIVPPEVQPKDGTTFKEAEESKWFHLNLNERRKAREAEKKYQEEKNKPKTLDRLADEGKFVEKEQGAPQENGKIPVEVRPGKVVEMSPAEYERFKESVINNR